MIHPSEDAALGSWFDQYREFALRWAQVAADERVDLFGVGSEMSALTSTVQVEALPVLEEYYLNPEKQEAEAERLLAWEHLVPHHQLRTAGGVQFASLAAFLEARSARHRAWAERSTFVEGEGTVPAINRRRVELDRRWRALITDVREVYRGPLTYAANFDQYQAVGFWDALDVMGINAYFPLRESVRPVAHVEELRAEILEGWRAVLEDIDTFRSEQGLAEVPVIFTELGAHPPGRLHHPPLGLRRLLRGSGTGRGAADRLGRKPAAARRAGVGARAPRPGSRGASPAASRRRSVVEAQLEVVPRALRALHDSGGK